MSRGPTDKVNDRGGGGGAAAFSSSAVNISALLKGTEGSSMCEFQQLVEQHLLCSTVTIISGVGSALVSTVCQIKKVLGSILRLFWSLHALPVLGGF